MRQPGADAEGPASVRAEGTASLRAEDAASAGVGSGGNPAELLQLALTAARAGAAVLARRDPREFGESAKTSDADLVTSFDLAAERAVREAITSARPKDVITGEELAPALPEAASGYRWSVDPLDGTMNFVRNIAYYGTSVAVAGPDGTWLAGVVHAPALRRVYYAFAAGGAWLAEELHPGAGSGTDAGNGPGSGTGAGNGPGAWNGAGTWNGPTAVRALDGPRRERKGRLLATSLTYRPDIQARLAAELPARMAGFGDFRRLGSAALELCAIAEGAVDAYLEYGLFEHDFAAGALIAEEAGAWVRRAPLSPAIAGLPLPDEALAQWTAASRPELAHTFTPAG